MVRPRRQAIPVRAKHEVAVQDISRALMDTKPNTYSLDVHTVSPRRAVPNGFGVGHAPRDLRRESGVAMPANQLTEFSVVDCVMKETGESREETARRLVETLLTMHVLLKGLGATNVHDENFATSVRKMWGFLLADDEVLDALKKKHVATIDALAAFTEKPHSKT